ncbi:hypothetical protein KKB43_05550 [Patescibacteria group bacterium]|nr:hypothetical protein [Patescibacteria group bacterium]MBU4580452.1 hypothetical protein [Patescibacteria group bacterium]
MKNIFKKNSSRGFAGIIALLTVCSLVLILTFSLSASLFTKKQISKNLYNSLKSYYLAESGTEDAIVRVLKNYNYGPTNIFTLDGSTIDQNISESGNTTTIDVSSSYLNNVRKLTSSLTVTTTAVSFYYGVQVGEGGLTMGNNALVIGNIYSNGIVTGGGSVITGDVIVANGMALSGIVVKGNVKANSIVSSKICGDAYYQNIDATSTNFLNSPTSPTCSLPLTSGTAHPGSTDMPVETMPITIDTIRSWEEDAEAGGVYSDAAHCNPQVNISIGPAKLNCNLTGANGIKITLTGTLWVNGNIILPNNVIVELSSGYGDNSGVIIADNIGNETVNGVITTSNNAIICGSNGYNSGSGTCNVSNETYIMFLSTHSGATNAINISNNATGAIFYAFAGIANVANNASIKEVTAYKLILANNATVTYESGLENATFSSGPGGGWEIISWNETE